MDYHKADYFINLICSFMRSFATIRKKEPRIIETGKIMVNKRSPEKQFQNIPLNKKSFPKKNFQKQFLKQYQSSKVIQTPQKIRQNVMSGSKRKRIFEISASKNEIFQGQASKSQKEIKQEKKQTVKRQSEKEIMFEESRMTMKNSISNRRNIFKEQAEGTSLRDKSSSKMISPTRKRIFSKENIEIYSKSSEKRSEEPDKPEQIKKRVYQTYVLSNSSKIIEEDPRQSKISNQIIPPSHEKTIFIKKQQRQKINSQIFQGRITKDRHSEERRQYLVNIYKVQTSSYFQF